MTDTRHYKAFISYSHSDEHWAKWLQRALEKYKLPKSFRQSNPELPARLYPIFRDRDELASGGELSESIRKAMEDSDALIVICSPAARASLWVNEEIKRFKASGRGERIFCFLVSGSPEVNSPDCAFPAAILQDEHGYVVHEPLAADATPKGDGKRNAMLKIAAGLLNVGVDDLKQRDAQRQARFWLSIAIGSLFIAALTIGLAIYALNAKRESELARKESELRRSQAEGLIGFMLGDLRKKLEPIGKLEILDAVGEQAMSYFTTLGDRGTPKELLSRAVALKQIGDVRFNQGKLEPALKAFQQALVQSEALYKSDPNNNDYLFELGQAEFWVGYVAYERGELERAETAMNNYMQYSLKLSEREPNNSAYQMELSYAYSNIASLARTRGQSKKALKNFELCRNINQQVLSLKPGDQDLIMSLAEALSWIGTTKQDLGDLHGSEQAFSEVIKLLLHQYESGQNTLAGNVVGKNMIFLADVKMNQGDSIAANKWAIESSLIFNGLTAQDPENAVWKLNSIKSELMHISFLSFSDWTAEHEVRISNALENLNALSKQDSSNNTIKQHTAYALRLQALRALHSGDIASAKKLAGSSYSAITETGKDAKDNANSLRIYAMVAETLGTILMASGERDKAKLVWQNAGNMLDKQPIQIFDFKPIRRLLAMNLGQTKIENSLKDELRVSGYKDSRMDPDYTLSGKIQ